MKRPFFLSLLLLCVAAFPAGLPAQTPPIEKAVAFPRGEWIHSKPLNVSSFDKKLTLLYFWDYTSINCLREIDILQRWQNAYYPYGFRIIYIHAPEFPFAAKKENVVSALDRHRLAQPVFLDNDFKFWEAYGVRSWPTKILVNGRRQILLRQPGEEKYLETEQAIRRELQTMQTESLPAPVLPSEPVKYSPNKCGMMSGETYVGYKRANWWGAELANRQWAAPDETILFKDRGDRVDRGFFVNGLWRNEADQLVHARRTEDLSDYLGILYRGYQVYSLVHRPTSAASPSVSVYVTRDDRPVPSIRRGKDLEEDAKGNTFFTLREPRLYHVIAHEDSRIHELKLWVREPEVSVCSFSFSNRCLSKFEKA